MENIGIFYDHLEYFMAVWYNLWSFGIICGQLVYFSQVGVFGPKKIWQPCFPDYETCAKKIRDTKKLKKGGEMNGPF
jgi:hypothetical protein